MSNVGRPREGFNPCPHCQATTRDSNGQCRCRNTLYRQTRTVTKKHALQATSAPSCSCGWSGVRYDRHLAAMLKKAAA